ncbi:hypothetical protein F5878DRAFT_506438, partial [Lentinula raphanica]
MNAFINSILGYKPSQTDNGSGILGHVSGYYGCVEAQGRGTLHCHMLIWVVGGLNPDEIKQCVQCDDGVAFRERLIAFLDDTISSSIIPDPIPDQSGVQSAQFHPCSVRGPYIPTVPDIESEKVVQKDRHFLSKCCQTHKHTATCYKYWRGPPDPRTCRFELDVTNVNGTTFFDEDTGELHLRKLDGLVNDFNETILAAVRCNMDLKFIGSGASAKAVMYYITDYITKSQLKAHVAYAALELAVKRLEPSIDDNDPLTVKAKRLLQRCAYAMINQQELSAQQVASYLLDFGDHFTSHSYNNLYWTSFESYVNDFEPLADSPFTQRERSTTPDDENLSGDSFNDTTLPASSDGVVQAEVNGAATISQFSGANEEITVKISSDQVVSVVPSQLEDYLCRNSKLEMLCV